ncbi:MAG: glycosyltransferase family 4 protein [Planctomycetaceae bacterium]|jgi:glycosyltransferase involved in cell wall biosynthesis|nr:glycosyltransferase family 4 protein [Planctomycetaceae bacterium]
MKPRLIFDIACFTGQPSMSGSLRYTVEVLERLVKSEKFDIVTICSLPEEEFALRNLQRYFHYQLPFQSKDVEHYVLPEKTVTAEKSMLRKTEDVLKKLFPDSRILKFVADIIRTVKWKLSPPPFLSQRKISPFYEKLISESDIYFSPFHPLISELNFNQSLRKVIVIHDLIPVIFTGIYKGHHFFQKYPWDSVTPDTVVFTDSESTKHDLLKYCSHILPEQVTTILLAADQRFSPCRDRNKIEKVLNKYSVPVNVPYILSVATLDIRKNFDHVMNSFARYSLSQNGIETNCHLVLTGVNGWQSRKFKKAFAHLPKNVREKIIFTGYVDDADLPLLYSAATCFCYMSLYEGFGLPPLEAMQCGTPVITSNTSSLPEVVGDAGIMLDPHDVEGLAEAFNRVLNDGELRKTMTAKGLEQAQKFSWDQCVATISEKFSE